MFVFFDLRVFLQRCHNGDKRVTVGDLRIDQNFLNDNTNIRSSTFVCVSKLSTRLNAPVLCKNIWNRLIRIYTSYRTKLFFFLHIYFNRSKFSALLSFAETKYWIIVFFMKSRLIYVKSKSKHFNKLEYNWTAREIDRWLFLYMSNLCGQPFNVHIHAFWKT